MNSARRYSTLTLLRPRAESAYNLLRTRPHIPLVVIVVLSVIFLWGIHLLGVKMLSMIDEVELISTLLKNYLLSAILLCLMFMLVFSNVINALSSLFLSEDLALPLASPAPISIIFKARFIEIMFKSSWMVVILFIPIMTAYASNFGTPLFFHLIWPLILLPFLIMTTAIGVIISLGMAALFPVQRTATALRAIFIIGIGAGIVVLRLLQPEQLIVPDNFHNFSKFLLSMHSPIMNYMPSYYLARIFISFLTMDFFHLQWLSVRYLPPAVICTILSSIMFSSLFFNGWRRMQIHHTDSTKAKQKSNSIENYVPRFFAQWLKLDSAESSIIEKEFIVFFRTPALWIQTAMIGVIILIYIYNIRLLPAESLASLRAELPSLTAFCNIGFISFIITAAALRFGFPSVSMERGALAMIVSSPCSNKKYLKIKYWTSAVPLCFLALLLALISSYLFQTKGLITITVVFDTLLLAAMTASLALMFGVTYGNLNASDFAEIPSGWGGMIFMISSIFLSALVIALQAYPFYLHFLITSSVYLPGITEKLTVTALMLVSLSIPFIIMYLTEKKAVRDLLKLL